MHGLAVHLERAQHSSGPATADGLSLRMPRGVACARPAMGDGDDVPQAACRLTHTGQQREPRLLRYD